MVVAEVLAGISLVKASVDFIKSNIDTAKDIGEIAGAIDGLFEGVDECQKGRSAHSKIGVKDQLGIKSVAQEVIDAKLAEEKLQEIIYFANSDNSYPSLTIKFSDTENSQKQAVFKQSFRFFQKGNMMSLKKTLRNTEKD